MTPSSKENILIIGGSGFLGKYLARECLRADMTVSIIGRSPASAQTFEKDIQYFEGDYGDPSFLAPIIKSVDVVVHLAHDNMRSSVNRDMIFELEQNIQPTMNLIAACVSYKISRLLFVSSGGTVYGRSSVCEPIMENAETRPISSYGCTKLILEQIGYLSHVQDKLPFIIARPANAYGPGQLPFRGQGFIATAFASALKAQTLNIFGDGTAIRDYIHARDIAEGILALIKRGKIGEIYNIGSSYGISLRTLLNEYISPIVNAEGFEMDCQYLPARDTDVTYNALANLKLKSHTGFSPRLNFEEGLRETWAWIKQLNNH